MSNIAKALVSVMCLAALSATASADTTLNAATSKPDQSPAVTTGSIDVEPSFEKRIEECMAIWDRKTHMTKAQWKRSCRTTLQSLDD
ncbi:hypothetical protein [Hyphomicrobium sp. NDB2Meth4]|uniref:hypothetical protein n=1 Tax=Hyphomicrobium sp. NDB2Meth4 TaxID=1892846 RepID=UPI000A626DED|nr:hypothetical protein [Hyphomicrobium sp. NDB2Meth4]